MVDLAIKGVEAIRYLTGAQLIRSMAAIRIGHPAKTPAPWELGGGET
jgi:hypothetical protein